MIIVFDLDGTLINSELRHKILLEKILKENKIKYGNKLDKYLAYKRNGNGNLKFLQEILGLDKELSYAIQQEWVKNIESKEYLEQDILYQEVITILEKIYKQNKIYYLTARANEENLFNQLEKLKIKKYAEKIFVVSPSRAIEEKRNVLAAIDSNNKILLIGDTEVEYEAGKELSNVDTKILNRGFRDKEFFETKKIKTYKNLFEVLKEQEE